MALPLHQLHHQFNRARRRDRIFRDRTNPFDTLNDFEFERHFRFSNDNTHRIIGLFRRFIEPATRRNHALSPECQILLTLHYLGTNSVPRDDARMSGVKQPTACRIIHKIASVALPAQRFLDSDSNESTSSVSESFLDTFVGNGVPDPGSVTSTKSSLDIRPCLDSQINAEEGYMVVETSPRTSGREKSFHESVLDLSCNISQLTDIYQNEILALGSSSSDGAEALQSDNGSGDSFFDASITTHVNETQEIGPSTSEEPVAAAHDPRITGTHLPQQIIASSQSQEIVRQPKRWRKGQNKDAWERNRDKRSRQTGQQFTRARSKTVVPEKTPMEPGCGNGCRKQCTSHFDLQQRIYICRQFWALGTVIGRSDFILKRTHRIKPKRHRPRTGTKPPRSAAFEYSFLKDGVKIMACRQFFLGTIGEKSDKRIRNAYEQAGPQGNYGLHTENRGQYEENRLSDDDRAFIRADIQRYPAVNSHYIRQDSTKLYMPFGLSKTIMYKAYQDRCEQEDRLAVSSATYDKVFREDFNIDFHKPQKDQCSTCSKEAMADGDEREQLLRDVIEPHGLRKNAAKAEKEADKKLAKESEDRISIACHDLQSVLLTPTSSVSITYFKRRFCTYNSTIYDMVNKQGYCCIWNENQGQRGSNEIGTSLLWYANNHLHSNSRQLIFWSDSRGARNRNFPVATGLLRLVNSPDNRLETIDQKFLEPGHTQMEVDQMHARIEYVRKQRFESIQVPWDWQAVIGAAVVKKKYVIHELDQDEIVDLKTQSRLLTRRKKNMEGQSVNWLKIKWLRYVKGIPDVIFYKNHFEGDFKRLFVQKRTSNGNDMTFPNAPLESVYKDGLLPISASKKHDLLEMVGTVIHRRYRAFYEALTVDDEKIDVMPEPTREEIFEREEGNYSDVQD